MSKILGQYYNKIVKGKTEYDLKSKNQKEQILVCLINQASDLRKIVVTLVTEVSRKKK